jgi:hypothetical protein
MSIQQAPKPAFCDKTKRFPVMNIRLHKVTVALQRYLNIFERPSGYDRCSRGSAKSRGPDRRSRSRSASHNWRNAEHLRRHLP